MSGRWQFWIDRGGTFTDIVARAPDASLRTLKLLSESPGRYADAAIEGMRRLLGLAAGERIDAERVSSVRMGTTVATNALLERRGEPVLLVVTRGYRDALRIATQARPRLFDRRIERPGPLYERVLEANERLAADGTVLEILDEAGLAAGLRDAHESGLRACAIVFMHGYRFTTHEQRAERLARAAGFAQVSVSHRVSPLLKFVPRADTTVVDAYLSPILARYVAQVAGQLPGIDLSFMQSSGGLAGAAAFHGKDAILSGPAGGIVGMAGTARAAGHARVIGFDMGGTSTDVSHYAGAYERTFDAEFAGVRVRAPMMNIHSIAAGGGSVVHFDGTRLRVGPQSAGAAPGPACYGRGGPATITDANVLLGRIEPRFFPQVFGARGDRPVDRDAAATCFAAIAQSITGALGRDADPVAVAAGALRIAVGAMANAIKRISVARGHDVSRYVLQCFGGAGGQHACLVAEALGMQRILCHPLAGVLSAYGMGLAVPSVMRESALERVLDAAGVEAARSMAARLMQEAGEELRRQGHDAATVQGTALAYVRYRGTDTVLPCALPGAAPIDAYLRGATATGSLAEPSPASAKAAVAAIHDEFAAAYRRRFAFLMPEAALIIESVSIECRVPAPATPDALDETGRAGREATAAETVARDAIHMHCFAADGSVSRRVAPLYLREELATGAVIDGPALVAEPTATIVVEPGWRASITRRGDLELWRSATPAPAFATAAPAFAPTPAFAPGAPATTSAPAVGGDATAAPRSVDGGAVAAADPAQLELFNNLFMNVAEQMGVRLQNTASSVNIKERLDFSCAVFDSNGQLIANAPHMPVHLGSMGESIRTVIDRNPHMRDGDVFALNDPYHGGTHLPDITVVTPVFLGAAGQGAASRGAGTEARDAVVQGGASLDAGAEARAAAAPGASAPGASTPGAAAPASPAPDFFVASRGHHADVGGITPGSMPPFSTHIDEEGVLFDNVALLDDGGLRTAALTELLTGGPHPARNPAQNLADLRAQIAANAKGAEELRQMVGVHGAPTVRRYMDLVQDNAEECVRRAIARLEDGAFELTLDEGAILRVGVRVDAQRRSACIDFTGTSAHRASNFNAPRAVTVAAVLYVFRTLVDDDIPLNAGCLRPLEIVVPEGSLLNPRPPAAVVAGNVETSTCVANALYGALGVMAAAQCTMNNFTFGNERHQYYETIAGGSGAGPGFAGADAVQTHMTNSRLTDPELLELRFPVRVDSHEILAGSGGQGRWPGGNGAVRRIRFLEGMTASILSNGRAAGAFGLAGGAAGAPGRNEVERGDGRRELLRASACVAMEPGDVFVVSTPGGGGYGR